MALPLLLLLLTAFARAAWIVLASVLSGTSTMLLLLLDLILSLAFYIGALMLLHGLFFATHRNASGLRFIIIALSILWAYDLNLYVAVLLRFDLLPGLVGGRSLVALGLAPLLAIAGAT